MTDRPTEPSLVVCHACKRPIRWSRETGRWLVYVTDHAPDCASMAAKRAADRIIELRRHAHIHRWRAIHIGVSERALRLGHVAWVLHHEYQEEK